MTFRLPILTLALLAATVRAYPPAPDHTLYGTVRDERGRILTKGTATVILSQTGGPEIVRGPIDDTPEAGVNYLLRVPLDSGTTGSIYRPTALLPAAGFTLRVVRNNQAFVPIELSRVPPTIGQPGKRTRLDLTLGVDSDGDGLPDAWEQLLIDSDRTGRLRTLADVKPGEDLDGDGLTNYQEYLLGTYALDKVDGLTLAIVEASGGRARLRFSVVTGRTYTIRGSSDLQVWAPQSFSLGTTSAAAVTSFRATEITIVDAWVTLPPGGTAFYRLYAE